MRRLSTALLTLFLAGAACPWAAESAAVDQGTLGGEEQTTVFVAQGECLRAQGQDRGPCLANPQGCARLEVRVEAGGQTCEICTDLQGRVLSELCGVGERAECSVLENNLGATCSICQTSTGTVLFDSCHEELPTNMLAGCESYTDANGLTCEICYADNGDVVRRDCTGEDLPCEIYQRDGQRCQRCVNGNGGTTETCEPLPPGPDYCNALSSADGSTCYTCYDANNAVVEHSCSGPAPVACSEYRTSDGATCQVCYDQNGGVVNRSCWRDPPPEQCHTYSTSDGLCTICYDAAGNITHRACDTTGCAGQGLTCMNDSDCAQGAACVNGLCSCEQAPSCELFTTLDGVLCEICGDLNRDGTVDVLDATCFPEPPTPVECWEETRSDSTGDSVVCTVCRTEQGEISETCSNSRPSVVCVVEQSADGIICEVCRDPNGVVVHTSCDDLLCHEEAVPSQGPTDQLVPCQLCERQGLLVSLACDMQNTCYTTGTDPADPPPPQPTPGAPPAPDPCGNLWLNIEPLQCGNSPWERWFRDVNNVQEIRPIDEGEVLREYYRSQLAPSIPVLAYRIERGLFDTSFCASCDCPRGDRIFIYVPANVSQRLVELGWRL
ncbi:MAG: hypothetical protein ABIJ09_08605 [Pseudomonadota bacterium]